MEQEEIARQKALADMFPDNDDTFLHNDTSILLRPGLNVNASEFKPSK